MRGLIKFRPDNILKVELKCGPTVLASGEEQADGSYKLSYTRDSYGNTIENAYISYLHIIYTANCPLLCRHK